jgi:hypothetical protein
MFCAAKSGMKALPKLLLALTAVAALSVAYPAKANLITNPGFETGDFTGWTTGGGSVMGSFNGVSPHSGSFQAVFSGPSVVLSQTLATMAGQSYTVDFWMAAVNVDPGGGMFGVFWGGSNVFAHAFAVGNTPYTEFTFNVTASSASTNLAFSIAPDSSSIFLDDVSVTPAGVPDAGSTLPLLGFASLGLAALRRKLGC